MKYLVVYRDDYLVHHGIKGQKWGVRRYQNPDGSLTPEGEKRYLNPDGTYNKKGSKDLFKTLIKNRDANGREYSILKNRLSNEQKEYLIKTGKEINKLDRKLDKIGLAYIGDDGKIHRSEEGSKILDQYNILYNSYNNEISKMTKNFVGEYGSKKYDRVFNRTYEQEVELILKNIGYNPNRY